MLEQPGLLARDRPPGGRRLPRLQLDPGAADDLRRGAQAAPGAPAALGGGRDRAAPLRPRRPGAGRRGPARARPVELADELREVLDDSVRAHLVADVPVGVLLSGGVDSGGLAALAARHVREPAADLLDRLRGGGLRRALAGAAGRRALRHRPPRAGPPPRRGRAAAEAGRGLRRALRRLLGAADLPRLAARRGRGQGRPLRRGRRRALRRLLHLRRRPPGAAASAASPRSRRPLAEALPSSAREGQLRLQSQALRPRRAALPPLERHHAWKEIFSAQARGLAGRASAPRLGPGRPLPRALRRDRGRRAAGAAAGPRPRHLPGRRPAGQDRPPRAWPTRWSCASPSSTRRSPSSPSSLPTQLKVRGFAKKRLLRQALAPLLPKEIVHGRKQGFSIPLAAWLRGPLEPFAREVLAPATRRAPGPARPRRRHPDARPPLRRRAKISADSSGA